MKITYKKVLVFMAIFLVGIFISLNGVKAASSSISASTTSPTKGQTVTVTGNVTAGAWNLTLVGASQSQTILGQTSSAGNETVSKSISFTAGEPGTTYNFTLTGGMTDFNSNSEEPVSKSLTITVANTPNNNSNGGSTNSGTTNTQTPSQNTPQKSSNANLKNLGIRPNDFSGFKPGTTTYNVTVPNSVTSVELYATKQDSKSTLTGTGTKTLKEGLNALGVTVTAENGQTKTYTVNVTRQAAKTEEKEPEEENNENDDTNNNDNDKTNQDEELNDDEQTKDGLVELKINDLQLSPDFKTGVYEYTAKYIGDATSLNIDAKASDDKYSVEIVGNKDLVEGENLITILVSNSEGKNIATYQITVNKSLVDEEALAREAAEKQEEKKKNIILASAVAVLIIIIVIIIIVVRSKKNKGYGEDYSIPYSKLNSDNDIEGNDEYDAHISNDDENLLNKKDRHKGKRFK